MISIKTFLYYCLLGIIGMCTIAIAASLAVAIMICFTQLYDKLEDLLN